MSQPLASMQCSDVLLARDISLKGQITEKSLCLAAALGVAKIITIIVMCRVTLYCAA